ncbi:hypothetical protein GIB67_013263, partial [Kingdonia uniflora]
LTLTSQSFSSPQFLNPSPSLVRLELGRITLFHQISAFDSREREGYHFQIRIHRWVTVSLRTIAITLNSALSRLRGSYSLSRLSRGL